MCNWKLAVPLWSANEIVPILNERVKMDLAVFCLLQEMGNVNKGDVSALISRLYPYKENCCSIHMCNDFTGCTEDGVMLIERDLTIMKALGIKLGVIHCNYPKDDGEVISQLTYLNDLATRNDIVIALENLPDSNNKSMGFAWITDPNRIAETIITNRYSGLGLCLDTSHLRFSKIERWNSEAIQKTLVAVHLSESRLGYDDHGVLQSEKLIHTINRIIADTQRQIPIIFEQDKFNERIESLKYFKKLTKENV